MVHTFKIENDKLIIDIDQILQYPLLQQIYSRDYSNDKSFADKEFRFIYYLTDRKGYCIKAGLSKIESYNFARKNAGLSDDYIPDKVIIAAIDFVKDNLNITAVEDLITSTIKGLNMISKTVRVLTNSVEDLMEKEIDLKAMVAFEESINQILKIANDIPSKIESLTELNNKWDKIEKGLSSIRGGQIYRNSYDGTDDRTNDASNETETLF